MIRFRKINFSLRAPLLQLLFFTLSLTTLFAEIPSANQLLNSMTLSLKKSDAMELSFELTSTDAQGSVIGSFDGIVQTQGSAFKLLNPELEVYCDGDSKWIYNIYAQEVTIFVNDTTQIDLLENPLGFLSSLTGSNTQFKQPPKSYKSRKPSNGKATYTVELVPVSRYSAYKCLTICVDAETYLPSVLMYRGVDDTIHTIEIKEINSLPLLSIENFRFPADRAAGLVVTDLR